MGKLASPAAFARALSLQRANARAKSSRPEGALDYDEKPTPTAADGQLSKRIDVMLTNIDSCSNIAIQSKDGVDNAAMCYPNCTIAIKRSCGQDIPFTAFKPCLSALSDRIDRGWDLWDRELSSMSSYASDFEGFLSGLQRSVESGSNSFQLGCKGKTDVSASSSSISWSEASFGDEIMQMDGSDSRIKAGPSSDLVKRNIDDNQLSVTNLSKASVGENEVERGDKLALVSRRVEENDKARCGSQALCDNLLRASTHIRKGCFLNREGEEIGIISTENGCYTRNARSDHVDNCQLMDSSNGKERESMSITETDATGGRPPVVADLPVNSVAVEKVSVNPAEDFRESMYEMMLEKGDVEEDMEELLNCYLLLNPAELHHMIREAFSHVWIDLIMSIR